MYKVLEIIEEGREVLAFSKDNVENDNKECWNCGEICHFEHECLSSNRGDRRQQNNYASTNKTNDANERLFVMQHVMNSS